MLVCDFLHLHIASPIAASTITSDQSTSSSPIIDHLTSLESPVTSLPAESFHVVVFSLLLEYLPSPAQRWSVCATAHSLLVIHGLLIIVTPDSHHMGRRAAQMHDWRRAIESIGFKRYFCYLPSCEIFCIIFSRFNVSLSKRRSPIDLSLPDKDVAIYCQQHNDEVLCGKLFADRCPSACNLQYSFRGRPQLIHQAV